MKLLRRLLPLALAAGVAGATVQVPASPVSAFFPILACQEWLPYIEHQGEVFARASIYPEGSQIWVNGLLVKTMSGMGDSWRRNYPGWMQVHMQVRLVDGTLAFDRTVGPCPGPT